jgi:tetratricopeptide (TPR) repeat protein
VQGIIRNLLCELREVPLHAAQQLHHLSAAAEREHRFEDALTFTNAELKLVQEVKAGPGIILVLLNRARLLFKTNQFSDAIPDLKDALIRSASENSLSPDHRAHICYTASNLIGASLWKQGDRANAAVALRETTRLARTRFGAGSPEVMKALSDEAFLAIEMRKPESELLSLLESCVREPSPTKQRGSCLSEIGHVLYINGLWDAAASALHIASDLCDDRVEKSESLLMLANIACFKSDMKSLHQFLNQAEELWMDVAPRPHLERHIANLRAQAALQEGCESTYREQILIAQQRGECEELTIEDQIQITFVRAQVLRRSGLYPQARQEIEEAQRLVKRAIVSPLSRCSILLQQAFCEQVEGNYIESNTLIDTALSIADSELDHNTILEARGRTLKAYNYYSLFTYNGPPPHGMSSALLEAKSNAETALRLLTEQNLDPHSRKILLRLLSGIAHHLELNAEQASYDRQLAILEARFPNTTL